MGVNDILSKNGTKYHTNTFLLYNNSLIWCVNCWGVLLPFISKTACLPPSLPFAKFSHHQHRGPSIISSRHLHLLSYCCYHADDLQRSVYTHLLGPSLPAQRQQTAGGRARSGRPGGPASRAGGLADLANVWTLTYQKSAMNTM